jgi:hypothetical protein
LSDVERVVLKPAISSMEKQMLEMAGMIAEKSGKRYPAYSMLLEVLGINDGLAGREALAELLVYADFVDSSLRVLERLLGLYKPIRLAKKVNWKLYNRKLHQATTRLALTYYKDRPNGRQCWELVKKIRQLVVTAQAPG